ncbi:MAG: DUF2974 domain-containing protein [Roseburia sp.]|nr:DUF2974 domain-containing protein [Roseburia sp.]
MGDILSYVDEFGGFTFLEKPFCEVDGLIFSHLSYFVYDNVVPGPEEEKPAVAFSDLVKRMDDKNFISVRWEEEKNRRLFDKVMNARRYRNTRADFYVREMDSGETIQFSAITFLLGSGEVFLSFRGTDDALVGWKEDAYMAYRTPVGAQLRSVEYAEQVAARLARKRNLRFYFGGHSKGGNLALYAGMSCNPEIKRRIARIYDMDGPGFRPDFLETLDYDGIKEKVLKLVPDESFVGMLMETKEDYTLIKSTQIGMAQHVALSWCVEGDRFLRAETNVPKRKELYDRINRWILELDREQVGVFLENLFKLVELTEASTLTDLKTVSADSPQRAHSIWQAYAQMDEETKRMFWEIGIFLAEVVAADQQERIRKSKVIDRLRQHMEEWNRNM